MVASVIEFVMGWRFLRLVCIAVTERSPDGAALNGSNDTLVTDCSQSVKLGVNRNDLGQQSVCVRTASAGHTLPELAWSRRIIDFSIDFPFFTAEAHTTQGSYRFYTRASALFEQMPWDLVLGLPGLPGSHPPPPRVPQCSLQFNKSCRIHTNTHKIGANAESLLQQFNAEWLALTLVS